MVEAYHRFRDPRCFHQQGEESISTLMTEAAKTSETLQNFYQTTPRCNSEDSQLHTCRRENLKSYKVTCSNATAE
jgi:hypothetical protein